MYLTLIRHILTFSLLLLFSCGNSDLTGLDEVEKKDRILTLNFILKTNGSTETVELKSKRLTEGKISRASLNEVNNTDRLRLECIFLNEQKEKVYIRTIPFPKLVNQDDFKFILREQYNDEWKYVEIKRRENDSQKSLYWSKLNALYDI